MYFLLRIPAFDLTKINEGPGIQALLELHLFQILGPVLRVHDERFYRVLCPWPFGSQLTLHGRKFLGQPSVPQPGQQILKRGLGGVADCARRIDQPRPVVAAVCDESSGFVQSHASPRNTKLDARLHLLKRQFKSPLRGEAKVKASATISKYPLLLKNTPKCFLSTKSRTPVGSLRISSANQGESLTSATES